MSALHYIGNRCLEASRTSQVPLDPHVLPHLDPHSSDRHHGQVEDPQELLRPRLRALSSSTGRGEEWCKALDLCVGASENHLRELLGRYPEPLQPPKKEETTKAATAAWALASVLRAVWRRGLVDRGQGQAVEGEEGERGE